MFDLLKAEQSLNFAFDPFWGPHGTIGTTITYDLEVLELALIEGFDSRFGARPMRRCIERLVGDALVEQILQKILPEGNLWVNGDIGNLRLQANACA